MTMTERLSDTQTVALAGLREHGALIRWPGGFWTKPGAKVKYVGGHGFAVPEWWFATGTINALVRRDWATYDGKERVAPTLKALLLR